VLVKINRRSGIAGANRTLAAMGIHERVAVSDGQSKGEYCVSRLSSQQLSYLVSHSTAITLPGGRTVVLTPKAGQHTVFKAGGTTGSGNTGSGNTGNTSSSGNFAPGTWHLVICTPENLGNTGSGNTRNTGNTGAG